MAATLDSPLAPPPNSQLSGTTERPRLAVFRSNEHIYAQVRTDADHIGIRNSSYSRMRSQVIDDTVGRTLATASSLTKDLKEAIDGNGATQVSTEGGNVRQKNWVHGGRIDIRS